MDKAQRGQKAINKPQEARPRHARALAATAQGVQPSSFHLGPKAVEAVDIAGDRKVVVVPPHDLSEPAPHRGHRFVPTTQKCLSYRRQCGTHALLDRYP